MTYVMEEIEIALKEEYNRGKTEAKTKLEGLIQFSLDIEDNNKGKSTAHILDLIRREMIKRIMD